MKRLIISMLIMLFALGAFTGCSSSRKSTSELRGLMLLDDIQLSHNKAFYSKHNMKARNDAYKRYARNSRHR